MKTLALCALAGGFLSIGYSQTAQSSPASREAELLERIKRLEDRLSALEAREAPTSSRVAPSSSMAPATPTSAPSEPALLEGTTFNVNFDGYYGYNFNKPVGR